MKVRIAVIFFLLLNVGFGYGFLILHEHAMWEIKSGSVPVYGDWKNIDTETLRVTDADAYHGNNVSYYLYSFSRNYPSGAANLTFVDGILNIETNFSEPANIGIGYAHDVTLFNVDNNDNPVLFSPITVFRKGFTPDWELNASYVNLHQVWLEQDLIPFHAKGDYQNYETVYRQKIVFAIEDETPAVFWSGNGTVSLNYTETWRYTPLDHYDNSTIQDGKSLLNSLSSWHIPFVVADIFGATILIGLGVENRRKEES